MHMPDRVLDPVVWATADAASAGLVMLAVRRTQRKLDPQDVPLMGVTCAFIFAGQMVNFPVAPMVSGHLLGGALAAILLGLGPAVLIMTTVLVAQCFLFADGGVWALGANVLNMALVAPAVALVVYRLLVGREDRSRRNMTAAFAAAWASVVASAACACLELLMSGYSVALVPPALGWHGLIGIGEGLITVAALRTVWSTRPDLQPRRALLEVAR